MNVRPFRALLFLLGAGLSVLAFGAIGREFYADFRLPQGSGMYHLLPAELAFDASVFTLGGIGWVCLWRALANTSLAEAAARVFRTLAGHGALVAAFAAVGAAAASATVASTILQRAVISDDEHVYQFIAQTLRTGALVAPSPGQDLPFFREQFVVVTERARYGKYPIGHPLLLAVGQALRCEYLVVPVIIGLLVLVTYALGRLVSGPASGLAAAFLFALSPQALMTGATYLSQPSAALVVGLAVLCTLRAERSLRPGWWLAGAGSCLGYGIHVRPLPVVLFLPVIAVYVFLAAGARTSRISRLAWLGAPVAVAVAALAAVNAVQAGSALVTAYGQDLAPGRGAEAIFLTTLATPAVRAMSVVGTLIRLNFWLFGWPCSLIFVAFARPLRPTYLLWGLVAAEAAYRVITPKVGVGGAGPLYVFEVVPLLCVLSADGAARLARSGRGLLGSPAAVSALTIAGTVVSLTVFLPSRLADLGRMGAAQNEVERLLQRQEVASALVFHEGVVPWWTLRSWAYYPRVNAPALDDDVLFVLLQRRNGLGENVEFWKRRYPGRSAWYFGYVHGQPRLVPLEAFVESELRTPSGLAAPPGSSGS